MKSIKFNVILRYLSYLSVSAVILQPFLGMNLYYLVLCTMFLLSLTSFFCSKKIQLNKFEIIFFIFILFTFFSKIYAISQEQANYAIKEISICFLSSFCISENILKKNDLNNKRHLMRILDVFNYSTCLMSLYLLIFDLPRIIGTHDRLGRLLFEEYGTYMVFSYSLIIACCYCFWKILYNYNTTIDKFIFIICFITGCFSGTRKVLFCLIIFIGMMVFIKYRKSSIVLIKYTFFIAICTIVIYSFITTNENLYKLIGNRVESVVHSVIYGESILEDASLVERSQLQHLAIEAHKDRPFFGYGINNFAQYSVDNGGPFLYAHNNYLELLSDVGIIGVTLYYGAYILILYKSFSLIKTESSICVFIFSFLLMTLISDYQTVSYYRFHYIFIYVLFSKYLYTFKYEKNYRKEL